MFMKGFSMEGFKSHQPHLWAIGEQRHVKRSGATEMLTKHLHQPQNILCQEEDSRAFYEYGHGSAVGV